MIEKVDIYHLEKSSITDYFYNNSLNGFEFNFINQKNIDLNAKINNKVIFFEEESYIDSVDLFLNILKKYTKKTACIIFSKNKNIHNVVKWMRKGASDYLLKNELNDEIVLNSIQSSIDYIENNSSISKKVNDPNTITAVKIPISADWNNLQDDFSYDLSIVMIEIILKNISRYSKELIEHIYNQVKINADIIAKNFGGKLWYWNNNFGTLVFHFGDHFNCSILTAIQFYNTFFLFCLESLKQKEVFDFKIAINGGKCIFNNHNTEHITSDVINSLTHLTKKFTKINSLNITESIYDNINQRLKTSFFEIDKFQDKKIFEYKFNNYSD
jgi:hypothetical protein